MESIWKQVAAKWRMIDEHHPSDVTIEDLTDEITDVIIDEGLILDPYEFMDSDEEMDDDDDWP
ncbi:hypothetical protein ACFPA1_08710 [Neobacillus sp. GCM10023253]|uniref:hypothetical protein n=1 Tax=Neobacillus sp. GCM10023253 TaxID=3252644 RepID=UPI00361F721F